MVRITLGMDDVLADTHGKLINIVLSEFAGSYTREDFAQKPLREVLHPKQLRKIHGILQQPGFFKDIAVKEKAIEVVAQLSKYYEIYVATAAMEFPYSFREKYDWLHHYFPFIPWTNMVFCGDKSVIRSDYLIDDHVHSLLSFKGKGILFSAPHNLKEHGFPRVASWDDIADLFLQKL
jgi:5'-nucleotidase